MMRGAPAVGLSLLLLASASSAVASDGRDLSEMTLEELLKVEVTVASKLETTVVDAPSSVTVFTQAQIRQMGVTTLQELLSYVAGYQTLRDVEQGDSERIVVRGRSTALSESVLVLVDGQRLNDLYTGGVSVLNRAIAVDNIQQVEVIRGPGSALYGANAFLGIIDIKTLRGQTWLLVGAGNRDARTASVNLASSAAGVAVSAFAHVHEDEGFVYRRVEDFVGLRGTQRDRQAGLDADLTVEYAGLTLRGRHMRRYLSGFLTFGALQDGASQENTSQSSLSLGYTRELTERVRLGASASVAQDRWRTVALFFPAGFEVVPGQPLAEELRAGPDLSTRVVRGAVDMHWMPVDANILIVGLELERSWFHQIVNLGNHHPTTLEYQGEVVAFTNDDVVFNEDTPRNVFGAYVQDTHKLGNLLEATAGVRLDTYSDFGVSANPRAALIYRTPFTSTMKAMYGRAFRAPNYLELHDRNNPVDFGNPDLEAENVDTVELAYGQRVGELMRASATYFHSRITNLITFGAPPPVAPDNPFGAPSFANQGRFTVDGAELEAQLSWERLILFGTLTYLNGEQATVPGVFAAAAVNYRHDRFNANVSGVVRGKIDALPDQDPYTILNARLAIDATDDVEVFLGVRNLLDIDYRTPASLIPAGVPNRGRLVLVGIVTEL